MSESWSSVNVAQGWEQPSGLSDRLAYVTKRRDSVPGSPRPLVVNWPRFARPISAYTGRARSCARIL
jgi:hypothetical protein